MQKEFVGDKNSKKKKRVKDDIDCIVIVLK